MFSVCLVCHRDSYERSIDSKRLNCNLHLGDWHSYKLLAHLRVQTILFPLSLNQQHGLLISLSTPLTLHTTYNIGTRYWILPVTNLHWMVAVANIVCKFNSMEIGFATTESPISQQQQRRHRVNQYGSIDILLLLLLLEFQIVLWSCHNPPTFGCRT